MELSTRASIVTHIILQIGGRYTPPPEIRDLHELIADLLNIEKESGRFNASSPDLALCASALWHRREPDGKRSSQDDEAIHYFSFLGEEARVFMPDGIRRALGIPPDLTRPAGILAADSNVIVSYDHPLDPTLLLAMYLSVEHGDSGLAVRCLDLISIILHWTRPDHPKRIEYETWQAQMCLVLFEWTAKENYLDDAVTHHRAAVALDDGISVEAVLSMIGLATALRVRYERMGNVGDLTDAVRVAEGACARQISLSVLDIPRPPHRASPHLKATADSLHARSLVTLIEMRMRLFQATGDEEEIEKEIATGEHALTKISSDNPEWSSVIDGLAKSYGVRYSVLKTDIADLDRSILLGRTVVGDGAQGTHIHNLSEALRCRYVAAGDERDLAEAIELAHRVVALARNGSTVRPGNLHNLATCLKIQFELVGDIEAGNTALAIFKEIAHLPSASPGEQLEASRAWGELTITMSGGDPAEALPAYRRAVGLLPLAAGVENSLKTRYRVLQENLHLAGSATAAAIASGRPELALRLVEDARAILWSQAGSGRDGLADLYQVDRQLATQLENLRLALNDDDFSPRDSEKRNAMTANSEDRRMELARQWETAVQKARKIRGFADLGRGAAPVDLTQLTVPGVVIVLTASLHGCYALIVRDGQVKALPLTGLSFEDVARRMFDYLSAVRELEGDPAGEDAFNELLGDLLSWTWDKIAAPVLTVIGSSAAHNTDGSSAKMRVWWCPTGLFSPLPIHAATQKGDGGSRPESLLDHVVSSYTATVRSLVRSLQRPRGPAGRVLAVTMPETPGHPELDLPGAHAELAMLSEVYGDGMLSLTGENATRPNVEKLIREFGTVHFSCHGRAAAGDPLESQLMLQDFQSSPLTTGDIARLDVVGDLAFLAACSTARMPLNRLLDESMQLSTAFQMAGYREVVACLWTVGDVDVLEVAREVHRSRSAPRRGEISSAETLHRTVLRLRERYPHSPWTWAGYIHIGT